jgi:hypothetical protein
MPAKSKLERELSRLEKQISHTILSEFYSSDAKECLILSDNPQKVFTMLLLLWIGLMTTSVTPD